MENNCYIGVDIGGTTFSSGLFDNSFNLLEKSKKELISNYHNRDELLYAIADQIKSLIKVNNISGVGISCPGPLNARDGIILDTPNLKILQNCNLKHELESNLKILCKIENDANLFALGEYFNNKPKNIVFIGITLGTGLGFGIVINGKLFTGGNGMAAEYGISPINNNSWETYNSIRWIEKKALDIYSCKMSPEEIYDLALNNDEKAILIWNEFGQNLGNCLSHAINMLDPNSISIGGGLSHAYNFFEESMVESIKLHSPSYLENDIKIYESKLKENAAMLGATLLFNN